MGDQPQADDVRSSALKALIERGYFDQASDLAAIDAALAGGMSTFYIGFDPSAASMHVGNLMQIMAMRLLQRHGHRPIALIGGGTALVGDPSGKTATRKMLTREQIDVHGTAFLAQFGRFLAFDAGQPNDAIMLNNADWLLELNYVEFLRDIGVHFTVNRMIATKTYRDRLDAELPLSFLEFNYQLLQAYDFLYLCREHGCTLQVGGSDQWGNMIAGVELIRRVGGPQAAQAHSLTVPLLTTADGKKMGKTERGAVWLDGSLLSPFDYYQYWISCDDRDVAKLLRLYTELPLAEIESMCAAHGAAINAAKARLALEATTLLHGADAAGEASTASRQAFGATDDWSAVPAVELGVDSVRLVDLVVDERIAAFQSKRQARQRIEAGAVKIDGEVINDPNHTLEARDVGAEGMRLQAGKKTRFRVLLGS